MAFYVRTAYLTGDPAYIDGCLDALETDGPKLLGDQPGYRGMSLFADRELGKIISSSWWDTEQARDASNSAIDARRAELFSPFAQTVAFDAWEAAVATPLPQVQPGAGFRTSSIEFDPARTDELLQMFENVTKPGLEAIPGFAATALLINRESGQGRVGVIYEDRAALVAARGPQAAVRGQSLMSAQASKSPVTVRSVEEFEVVLLERKPV
jgi:heme-degrading monooxygenase HmoA